MNCTKELRDKGFYNAACVACNWYGCSCDCKGGGQIADTGDYSDPICPEVLQMLKKLI